MTLNLTLTKHDLYRVFHLKCIDLHNGVLLFVPKQLV